MSEPSRTPKGALNEQHSRENAARMLCQNYPNDYEWAGLLFRAVDEYDRRTLLNVKHMLIEARRRIRTFESEVARCDRSEVHSR